ncbi:hypothetical protein ANTQUA_LOCUS10509 [Anthophora quadrimaculata]
MILQELRIITLTHEEIVELRRRKFTELTLLDEWMGSKGNEEIDRTISEEPFKRSIKSRTRHSLSKRSRKCIPSRRFEVEPLFHFRM